MVGNRKSIKRGKLYSYTYQSYQPPAPFKMEPFEPYAIGMVDFPEGLRVYGIINRMENLRIGMEAETTVGKLYEDEENEYIIWDVETYRLRVKKDVTVALAQTYGYAGNNGACILSKAW